MMIPSTTQFGYPSIEKLIAVREGGRPYRVQYVERVRFECHPENPPPYGMLLGQFGHHILGDR